MGGNEDASESLEENKSGGEEQARTKKYTKEEIPEK